MTDKDSSVIENDFGIEAINEILKFMEDNRSDIVIIFAGYTNDMEKFIASNDGLKSRVPNVFDFTDYSIDELVEIGLIDLYAQQYKIEEEKYAKLVENNYKHTYDSSNGRWVRNLNELIIRKLAIRLMNNENHDLFTIVDSDLDSLFVIS